MDSKSYKYCVDTVAAGVRLDALDEIFREKMPGRRVDGYVSLLRISFMRCPIGTYNGEIYFFTGRIYEVIGEAGFGNLIYDVMERLHIPAGDYGRIEGIVKVCRRVVAVNELRLSVDKVVFSNCVYNVRSGETERFGPECVQFHELPYAYEKGAKGHIWDEFLRQVLPNDSYRSILQEFVGSLFIPRSEAKMETLMILKGSGSNGKSVVFDTLVGVLGRDNVSNFGLDEICGTSTERKRNIASMNGKRLNYASETRRFVIDGVSGTLKALISGEPVTARAMYGINFTAYDIPQIMINTNQMPEIKDWSYGMRRRMCILPFNVEIPKWRQNKSLSADLRAEYPYIFNWIMEGRRKFIANKYKLDDNTIMDDLMDEFFSETNSVLMYANSEGWRKSPAAIIDQPPVWMRLKDFYSGYCRWCLANDEYRETRRAASKILEDAGFKRRRSGSRVFIAFYGEKAEAYLKSLLERKNRQHEVLAGKLRDMHVNVTKVKDMIEDVQKETGWKRIIVGFRDLAEFIDLPVNVPNEVTKGSLEGYYEMYKGLYFFNADEIARFWIPQYEKRLRSKELRRIVKEQTRITADEALNRGGQIDLNSLSMNEILKHFDNENGEENGEDGEED